VRGRRPGLAYHVIGRPLDAIVADMRRFYRD